MQVALAHHLRALRARCPRRAPRGLQSALIAILGTALLAVGGGSASADGGAEMRRGAARGVAIDHVEGVRRMRRRAADRHPSDAHVPGETGYVISDQVESVHSGVSHVWLRQTVDGLEVFGGDFRVSVERSGRVLDAHDGFRSERPRRRALPPRESTSTHLTALEAIEAAAAHLGLALGEPLEIIEEAGDVARSTRATGGGIALGAIPVKRMYLPVTGELRRVWNLQIRSVDARHWWNLNVDVESGEVLTEIDWARDAAYRVHLFPLTGPEQGGAADVVDPFDPMASPLGWHVNLTGTPATEATEGNNALVREDWNADGEGESADGGSEHAFLFDADLARNPQLGGGEVGETDAAITNVFYWVNLLHDIYFSYGFDELAGNFQFENYTAQGLGMDQVIADVQDGADHGTQNNARFVTGPDGEWPLFELYLFAAPEAMDARVRVSAPATIAFDHPGHQLGGPALDLTGPSAPVMAALDAAEPGGGTVRDACSPLDVSLDSAIALVDDGHCSLSTKVANVEAAGAVGAIFVNRVDESWDPGTGPVSAAIPVVYVGRSDGDRIRSGLGAGVTAALTFFNEVGRIDPAFANDLIVHEYTHGLSQRLVGGPGNASCMLEGEAQAKGIGEGWSDFFALAIPARPGASRAGRYPFAAHTQGGGASARGLRERPYSTDSAVNDLVYSDIAQAPNIWEIGAVFTSALWDLYWNLVDEHGFDENVYAHEGGGGNNIAIQLAVDAMKVLPCQPTFLEGRDALLTADLALAEDEEATEGPYAAAIWCAFAGRGMGQDAQAGSALDVDVQDGFSSPIPCPEPSSAWLQIAAVSCLGIARWRRRGQDGGRRFEG